MSSSPLTPIDLAHAAMEAAPEDDSIRLAYFDRLASCELFLLLEAEAEADRIRPLVFEVEEAKMVVAFDREERLTAFAGAAAPYAALSGRALATMLDGQALSLGLNLGAPSETVLEAEAMTWLATMLADLPTQVEERPETIRAPRGLPERLLTALDARLASATGLAQAAWLVEVSYVGGRRGHLLAFVAALPGAEAALAESVGAALGFSGLEAASLDVGFFRAGDPVCDRLAKVGLRFDLPELMEPMRAVAPGMDPAKPPRLR